MTVTKLTALHHTHLALGAVMTDEQGWQVPDRYPACQDELLVAQNGVGVCDISAMGKWDVKGSAIEKVEYGGMGVWEDGSAHAHTPTHPHPHTLLPVGQVSCVSWQGTEGASLGSGLCCRLAQDNVFFTASPAHSSVVGGHLTNGTAGCSHVTDVTSTLCALCLIGPRSRDVLAKLSSLNLTDTAMPHLSCAHTHVAKVRTLIVRYDVRGLLAYQLFCTRDYAEFVWEALMAAGIEFGIGPLDWQTWGALNGET